MFGALLLISYFTLNAVVIMPIYQETIYLNKYNWLNWKLWILYSNLITDQDDLFVVCLPYLSSMLSIFKETIL